MTAAQAVPCPSLAALETGLTTVGESRSATAGCRRRCELARFTRSPGIRRELVDLAKRYDRRGE